MKMRSTGLGETVLVGELDKITQVHDYLILHVNTLEPVQWHVRAALEYKDLFTLIKLIIKGPVLKFLVLSITKWKNPRNTDDF